ncbi:hypothetical protein BDV41DRAFT_567099 [Aspergillus transmontanensis]|uniref:Zn(2)-C6 fungal-type domain-containing protein n=1 Tax=Aspergillus transmontanensis TaxID=1034304 RepID=A0A5N6VN62_9EURO|nr:hypothetical protein BDV41DRAFT_567099 [Aspergillus transmontanensis]
MRIGRGCERCRLRHIRCTTRAGASSCNACARLGRTCRLDPPFRFKTVRHVYQKSQGTASKFELEWDSAQTWVNVPRSLTFVQESAEESADGSISDAPPEPQRDTQISSDGPHTYIPDPFVAHLPISGSLNPHDEAVGLPHVEPAISTPSIHDEHSTKATAISPGAVNDMISPLASNSTWSPMTPSTPRSTSSSTMTSREAFLLRSYINKISHWLDICDSGSTFNTEVPRRALHVPMVLKAVLALSARHDAIMSGASDWEASEYHSQCVELLLAALARPEETYDDNMLISVVILRIYEELESTTDEKCHWLGSNRLLNTMSRAASSGGLTEAASWQFLRQAIYASVVQNQPMQLDLRNYERSSVFKRGDDGAYANTIIFYCARIIQLCSEGHVAAVDEEDWHGLSSRVEQWYRDRPVSWQPLQYKDANPAENRPFPELWVMSPPAVVGLQYYHACQILLTSSDRHWGVVSNYERARLRRIEEVRTMECLAILYTHRPQKVIASHVVQVIGLSSSNETVENAYFMACHLLYRYGHCLRHPVEKRGSLKFLTRVESSVGWRTGWIIRELEDQWNELQGLDSWG